MAFCTGCGASVGAQQFCSSCGRPAAAADETIVRGSAGLNDETATGLPPVVPVYSQPTQPPPLPQLPTLQPQVPQIPQGHRRSRNPWLIALVLLVIVLLGIVAFIVTKVLSDKNESATKSAPSVQIAPTQMPQAT